MPDRQRDKLANYWLMVVNVAFLEVNAGVSGGYFGQKQAAHPRTSFFRGMSVRDGQPLSKKG
jgi:hypothetical protein